MQWLKRSGWNWQALGTEVCNSLEWVCPDSYSGTAGNMPEMNSAVFQLMKGTPQLGANVSFFIIPRGECKPKIGQRKLKRDRNQCSCFWCFKATRCVFFQKPRDISINFRFLDYYRYSDSFTEYVLAYLISWKILWKKCWKNIWWSKLKKTEAVNLKCPFLRLHRAIKNTVVPRFWSWKEVCQQGVKFCPILVILFIPRRYLMFSLFLPTIRTKQISNLRVSHWRYG